MCTSMQKSSSGDTIILRGGTHCGGLVVSKGVKILGENNAIVCLDVLPSTFRKGSNRCEDTADSQPLDELPSILSQDHGCADDADSQLLDVAPSIVIQGQGKVQHKPRIQTDVFCCRAKGVVLENIRIEASCKVESVYSADGIGCSAHRKLVDVNKGRLSVYSVDKELIKSDQERQIMCSADEAVYSADRELIESDKERQGMCSADEAVYSADRELIEADKQSHSMHVAHNAHVVNSTCTRGVHSADKDFIEADIGRHSMFVAHNDHVVNSTSSRGVQSTDRELIEADIGRHSLSAVHCVNILKGTCELTGESPRCVLVCVIVMHAVEQFARIVCLLCTRQYHERHM
jgi:hypothetical protein